jgi:CRISPR associated protein Cas1
MITGRKLAAQADTAANVLGRHRDADEIRRIAHFLDTATLRDISLIEAEAARYYFRGWTGITIAWKQADARTVPDHWLRYSGRTNPIGKGNRNAIHPINAMLNYAYRMLEIEARLACLAAGLNPALGFLHLDRYDRASLATDLMEAARPVADRHILGMLDHPGNELPRRFTRARFTEVSRSGDLPPGTVRLVAPLSHEIAEQSIIWAATLYPVAEQITRRLAATAAERFMQPRNITADQAIMRPAKTTAAPVALDASEVIPDRLWEQIEPLAIQLPSPQASRTSVRLRDVVAALICARALRRSRESVAPHFHVSANTLNRRFTAWRDLDQWHKIETTIREHRRQSRSRT